MPAGGGAGASLIPFSRTMSDYLYDIALGVDSPQAGFVEEMEVESPTPAQGAVVPGSPEDQLLRDLAGVNIQP